MSWYKKAQISPNAVSIYLDDERPTPPGFLRCYWPDEVIQLLQQHPGNVNTLSLDHDLGDDNRGTGNDVVRWIEEQVYTNPDFIPPKDIIVHSANASAAEKMRAGIANIYRKWQENQSGMLS